ncbi:hypothetical protein [uncultured Clostridium sp.]|uniref:hypothetical protein n=1 Tax=uncultured Clostridium sp. TaxID=59620 RepID=UPI0026EFF3DF|nr:hypothetical protein [uncultured Clostridium sp.]
MKITEDYLQYKKEEVENIFDKIIIISQLSEGGITYGDCENMDTWELEYMARKLIKLKKEENEMKRKQIEEARKNRG